MRKFNLASRGIWTEPLHKSVDVRLFTVRLSLLVNAHVVLQLVVVVRHVAQDPTVRVLVGNLILFKCAQFCSQNFLLFVLAPFSQRLIGLTVLGERWTY